MVKKIVSSKIDEIRQIFPGENGSALQNQTGSALQIDFRPPQYDLQPQSALQKVVRFKKKTSCQKEEKKPVRSK